MTRDDVLELCGDLLGAVEDYPFGDEVAVFKVGGKMFALVMLEGEPGRVNLKCDPDLAIELREMIDHSYDLVLRKLPRRVRDGILGRG